MEVERQGKVRNIEQSEKYWRNKEQKQRHRERIVNNRDSDNRDTQRRENREIYIQRDRENTGDALNRDRKILKHGDSQSAVVFACL